jgi:hypothetical protein
MRWVVNATTRPLYLRERPGTHCTGGWVSLRVAPTGIRSPDRPARRDSLYRLEIQSKLIFRIHTSIRAHLAGHLHSRVFVGCDVLAAEGVTTAALTEVRGDASDIASASTVLSSAPMTRMQNVSNVSTPHLTT